MKEKNSSEYIKALEYHNKPIAGKIALKLTKPLLTQYDLALAYSPGVAAPCLEIKKNVENIYNYTARGNTVAVISNGTAVLGLGNLGAAASKPVMEGKAVLFKKFADIDCFDVEVDCTDPDQFVNIVKNLGYSWGGINLEDIKAPECFLIEEKLKAIMNIPVFHDDQHGTAIITAAGLINALYLTNKKISQVKIVINGAGAAAISSIKLIIALGANKNNITLCDTLGVIYKGRTAGINKWKMEHATDSKDRSLSEAIKDADVFLGLSIKGAVTKKMIASMNKDPIIFALANPDPEIKPEDIMSVRDDAIIATGRSDYNNQINNLLGFPYVFRGALDVRASEINEEMKIAAAKELAYLARKPVPEEVYKAYGHSKKSFGREYLIPVPFDPRLIMTIPIAVAQAAIDSGVAKVSNFDIKQYKTNLYSRFNPTSNYMNFVYNKIISTKLCRIVFAEGEEEEVIKSAIIIRNEGLGYPILIGRKNKILSVVESMGESYSINNINIINAAISTKLDLYINTLYKKLQRKGFLYRDCVKMVKSDKNIFAACMVVCNDGDVIVTGLTKSYYSSLDDVLKMIDIKKKKRLMGYSILLSKKHNIIIADNNHCEFPTSEDLVDITLQAATLAKSMGYIPRVALLAFSNFGNPQKIKSKKVQDAIDILDNMNLDFEYEGEVTPDIALSPNPKRIYPFFRLTAPANVLIMPNLESAAISTHLLEVLAGGVFIGPILDGLEHPVQIVPIGSSSTEIVSIAALAVNEFINNKLNTTA